MLGTVPQRSVVPGQGVERREKVRLEYEKRGKIE